MSSWDITPEDVSSVLEDVQDAAQTDLTNALNDTLGKMGSAQETCTKPSTLRPETGEAPLVAMTLSEWYSRHEGELGGLGTRVVNVATSTVGAVRSYLDYDEEAAAEFQNAAAEGRKEEYQEGY